MFPVNFSLKCKLDIFEIDLPVEKFRYTDTFDFTERFHFVSCRQQQSLILSLRKSLFLYGFFFPNPPSYSLNFPQHAGVFYFLSEKRGQTVYSCNLFLEKDVEFIFS